MSKEKTMIHGKKIVALCAYGISDPQVFSFITELNDLLREHDCFLFIYTMNTEIGNGGEFYEAETSVYDLIHYDRTDAVVIMDEKIKSREVVQHIIDSANANNVPAIVIDGKYDNVSCVDFDYAKGFEAVVRHIIEDHKVRKPHFMAGKKSSEFSNERLEVFKKVTAENGIEFDDSMLSYGDFWSAPSRAATRKLLERNELPEAIICANDIMAINVCDILQSAGIKTPDQILVSGFDGIDEAFLTTPGITTAICDSHSLANTVMESVLAVLSGERNFTKYIVPKFVANESCGCKRVDLKSLSKVHELNNRFYHHQDDIHIMQNLTAMLMCSHTFEECTYHIRHSLTDNMCCVVEDAIFDVEKNYFLEDVKSTTKSIIYNSYSNSPSIVPYCEEQIVPYIDEIMNTGYPLIFNALEYMGKSIGFVCYSFEKYSLVDWSRTPSMTNCLSMGLGGFITFRYQDFLREKIMSMYQNDALTGLYNRLAFLDKYEELKSQKSHKDQTMTLIMADLNGLKQINDTRGHSAGDQAISSVARALKETCPVGSLCVRYGGDEMLALIPQEIDEGAFRKEMELRLDEYSNQYGFTISASYGSYKATMNDSLDLDKIISIADSEMYKMKKEKHKS